MMIRALVLLLLTSCGPAVVEPIVFGGMCCQVPLRNDNKYEPLDHSMDGRPCEVRQTEFEYAVIENEWGEHMMYGGYTPEQMAAKNLVILNVRLWTQTGYGVVECRQDQSWLDVMALGEGVILSDWECKCVGDFKRDMPNPFDGAYQ